MDSLVITIRPKSNCKTCHGSGAIGTNTKSKRQVICSCLLKQAESQYEYDWDLAYNETQHRWEGSSRPKTRGGLCVKRSS